MEPTEPDPRLSQIVTRWSVLLRDPDDPGPAGSAPEPDFVAGWRRELLDRTWKALSAANPVYHAALAARVDDPDATSGAIAERLAARTGKPMRADHARKTLQRAHEKFATLLIAEVARSLGPEAGVSVADELRELDLLKYCRSAFDRRS